jgi:hypothetical protein
MSGSRFDNRHKPMTRRKLMQVINHELTISGDLVNSRITAPTVFALADAAKVARGRTVTFYGVKFKLKVGLWLSICQPDGTVIFNAPGGVL